MRTFVLKSICKEVNVEIIELNVNMRRRYNVGVVAEMCTN